MAGDEKKPRVAALLSGGGARAAYQVGVLKAVAELLPPNSPNPFPILCGTSAGAINAAALAVYARNYQQAVRRLEKVWANFHVNQVFRADARGLMTNALRWMTALAIGGMGRHNPRALLDREPLQKLLERVMPCEQIRESVAQGWVEALSVTVSGYTSGQSVTFYEGHERLEPWKRVRRVGAPTEITVEHLMASSAIPFIFEPVKIHREYFGDGSMRQIAPLSPALHLGAERILVIGVRQEDPGSMTRNGSEPERPTLAQIGGHVLSSIFLDSLEADLERLQRINQTVSRIPMAHRGQDGVRLREVEAMHIAPSLNLSEMAFRHRHRFPRPVRFLLRGVGAWRRGGGDLVSYLLFEREYCEELIALGYADARARRDELAAFLGCGKP